MIKRVSMVRFKEGVPLEEAQRIWIEQHSPMVKGALEGLRRYTVNLRDPEASEQARHPLTPAGDPYLLGFDGFAETWWDDVESMTRSLSQAEEDVRSDEDDFIAEIRIVIVREHEILREERS